MTNEEKARITAIQLKDAELLRSEPRGFIAGSFKIIPGEFKFLPMPIHVQTRPTNE